MKIAIVGIGGVGGLMAALLVKAGEDVTVIARGDGLRAIQEHGISLESGMGNLKVRPRLATDRPAEAGVMDLIIVATKAWQVEEAAHQIKPMIGPETVVLPVQNGLEAPDILSGVLGNEHVLVGTVGVTSYLAAPAQVVHRGDSISVRVGEQDSRKSPRVMRIVEMMQAARMDCAIPTNSQAALWRKLVPLSAWSVVGSLTRVPMGVWRRFPGTVGLYRGLMEESVAVATALGVTLPIGFVLANVEGIASFDPEFTTSMQRDVMAGKPSELECQVGVIVRKGKEAAVGTPLYEAAYNFLLPQESVVRGQAQ